MNFTSLDNNGKVEGFALVKNVEQKVSSKGDTYLDFTLGDSTGEINAKLWRYEPMQHGSYKVNDIVKIRGTVSQYLGADQLKIDLIRSTNAADNISMDELVKTAAYSGEQMYDELMKIADKFADVELKAVVKAIYEEKRNALLFWPAAFKLHHALRGGLLMHTLSIVRLCQSIADIYPFVNSDLLIAGAMLHDVAKTEEFSVNEAGTVDTYSLAGNLLGHLTMGAEQIGKICKELNISENTEILLKHMVLSHHGEPDFGAAVRPMFIEAEILAQLDLLDARVFEMREAVAAAKEGEFTSKLWALDNRKFYNHAKSDLEEEVKLF